MYLDTLTTEQLIVLAAAALIGSAIVTYVCYIAAYRTHKNAKIEAQQQAALAGETVPEYEMQKVEDWWVGYKAAGILILFLGAGTGILLTVIVSESHALTMTMAASVTCAGSLIGGLLIDRYLIHPLADNTFYEKVEEPLVQSFLEIPEVAEATESVTLNDLKDMILQQQKDNADIRKRLGLP